jgi:hypothetical protein
MVARCRQTGVVVGRGGGEEEDEDDDLRRESAQMDDVIPGRRPAARCNYSLFGLRAACARG